MWAGRKTYTNSHLFAHIPDIGAVRAARRDSKSRSTSTPSKSPHCCISCARRLCAMLSMLLTGLTDNERRKHAINLLPQWDTRRVGKRQPSYVWCAAYVHYLVQTTSHALNCLIPRISFKKMQIHTSCYCSLHQTLLKQWGEQAVCTTWVDCLSQP